MSGLLYAPKRTPEPTTRPTEFPIRCHLDQFPSLTIVVLSILFAVCSYLIGTGLTALPAGFWFALGCWVAVCLGLPLAFGIWFARAAIVADEDGLYWRGMGRWQSARWDEVTDYYQQIWSTGAQERTVSVAECGTRRLYFSKGMSGEENCLRLQSAISKYAVNARATEWQVLGTRPDLDWPRTFRYDTRANRWKVHQVSIGLTLITLIVFFPWHLSYSTVWWKAISLTSVLVSISWLGFKMWLIWKVKQSAHRHFDEQITVMQEGICWEKRDVSIAAAWSEIVNYVVVPDGQFGTIQRITTPEGIIDFDLSIQDFANLEEIVTREHTKKQLSAAADDIDAYDPASNFRSYG